MNASIAVWLVFRALRWVAWIAFLVWAIYFWSDPQPYLNSFGHMVPAAELAFFVLGNLAVFSGLFELMMREKAGVVRPSFGQLIPPRAA